MTHWSRAKGLYRAYLLATAGAMVAVPLILEGFGYQPFHSFLGILLFAICLYPTVRYLSRHETGLPTIAILCLAYALQFAVPVFTREASIELAFGEVRLLNDSDVTAALLLAIAGAFVLQAGYYWFKKSQLQKSVPIARLELNKSKAVLYCVIVGLLLPLLFNLRGIIPNELQQPLSALLRVLQNQVLVAIGVLGWIYYARRDSKWYGVWLYALVALTALRGISTGSIEEALVPIGVLFMVKWVYTRRMSLAMVAVVVALTLFLSPVKGDYRQQVWLGEAPDAAQMSSAAKVRLWVGEATDYWIDTLSGNRNLREATAGATGRADFIHQVAHIHSMTPAVVPFQYGSTYSYFAVALIPRIFWPEKPTAGDANGFFAVSYGLTTEEGAKTTTFGVSLIGEAFINFGWPGVVVLMLLQGLIISLLERLFAGVESGPGGQAVFIAFFIFFLNGIGSSAEILFGNILQNLLCGYLLLLWARKGSAWRSSVEPLAVAGRASSI